MIPRSKAEIDKLKERFLAELDDESRVACVNVIDKLYALKESLYRFNMENAGYTPPEQTVKNLQIEIKAKEKINSELKKISRYISSENLGRLVSSIDTLVSAPAVKVQENNSKNTIAPKPNTKASKKGFFARPGRAVSDPAPKLTVDGKKINSKSVHKKKKFSLDPPKGTGKKGLGF